MNIDLILFHPDCDIVIVWRCFKIGHSKKNVIVPSVYVPLVYVFNSAAARPFATVVSSVFYINQ